MGVAKRHQVKICPAYLEPLLCSGLILWLAHGITMLTPVHFIRKALPPVARAMILFLFVHGAAAQSINVAPLTLSMDEDGAAQTFTVVLDANPTADVCIVVGSGDPTEAAVSPTELIFSSSNGTDPQTVTVTPQQDFTVDEDVTFDVVLEPAISSDGNYHGLDPDNISVTVRNVDFPFTNAQKASYQASVQANCTLPVELVAFYPIIGGNMIHLHWKTASETNNAGFEVQHRTHAPSSGGGQQGEWQALAWVPGSGTTNMEQTYQISIGDRPPGIHRFRLKQVDYDGSFMYGPEVEGQIAFETTLAMGWPHPNPSSHTSTIVLRSAQDEAIKVYLVDLMGRTLGLVYEGNVQAFTPHPIEIATSMWAVGTYLILAESRSSRQWRQLSVVR